MQNNGSCDISFHGVKIDNLKTNKEKIQLVSKRIRFFYLNSLIFFDHRIYTSVVSFMVKKELVKKLPNFFFSAPTLDYYLIMFGSISGGAIYIPKVMASYRLYSDGSWHISQRSSTQYLLSIKSLIDFKKYLKYSYFSVIGIKILEYFLKYIFMKCLRK